MNTEIIYEVQSGPIWDWKVAMDLFLGGAGVGAFLFAVFLDAGTAWTDDSDDFHRSWIGGGGIGLRLALPSMVVVRLDIAVGQNGAGVSFAIGSREKAEAARDRVR